MTDNLIAKLSAGLYCTFTLANCRQIHTLLLLWQGPVMSRARRRKVGIVDYRIVRTVVGQLWTAPESCPRLFHDDGSFAPQLFYLCRAGIDAVGIHLA